MPGKTKGPTPAARQAIVDAARSAQYQRARHIIDMVRDEQFSLPVRTVRNYGDIYTWTLQRVNFWQNRSASIEEQARRQKAWTPELVTEVQKSKDATARYTELYNSIKYYQPDYMWVGQRDKPNGGEQINGTGGGDGGGGGGIVIAYPNGNKIRTPVSSKQEEQQFHDLADKLLDLDAQYGMRQPVNFYKQDTVQANQPKPGNITPAPVDIPNRDDVVVPGEVPINGAPPKGKGGAGSGRGARGNIKGTNPLGRWLGKIGGGGGAVSTIIILLVVLLILRIWLVPTADGKSAWTNFKAAISGNLQWNPAYYPGG